MVFRNKSSRSGRSCLWTTIVVANPMWIFESLSVVIIDNEISRKLVYFCNLIQKTLSLMRRNEFYRGLSWSRSHGHLCMWTHNESDVVAMQHAFEIKCLFSFCCLITFENVETICCSHVNRTRFSFCCLHVYFYYLIKSFHMYHLIFIMKENGERIIVFFCYNKIMVTAVRKLFRITRYRLFWQIN